MFVEIEREKNERPFVQQLPVLFFAIVIRFSSYPSLLLCDFLFVFCLFYSRIWNVKKDIEKVKKNNCKLKKAATKTGDRNNLH